LLPKYRGAACIQAAIDAGDAETGITSMHVIRELDAGDVILTRSIPIAADETGGSLHDRLADLATQVLEDTLKGLATGSVERVPQDVAASSHVSKLNREDGRIDWSQTAIALERRIRAYDPWPGTYTIATEDGRAKRVKIFPPTTVVDHPLAAGEILDRGDELIVGCGQGALCIEYVQPEGGVKMLAANYLRGRNPTSLI